MFPGIGDGFISTGGQGPTISGPGWGSIPGIPLPGGGSSGSGKSSGSGLVNWLSLWLAPSTSSVISLLLRFVLLILGLILIAGGIWMLKPVQRAVSTTVRVGGKAAAMVA